MTFAPTLLQHDILALIAPSVESYLEIGVQEGRSLSVVCTHAHKLQKLTLCDDWGPTSGGSNRGDHLHIEQLLLDFHISIKPQFLDGDSRDLLPSLNEAHDLVLVDGGHSFDVASSDIQEGWRLCTKWLVRVDCCFGGHGTAIVWKI